MSWTWFWRSDLLERKGGKEKKKSWTWKRGSCGISSCHDSAISAPTKEFALVSLAVSATEKDPAPENPAYFVAGDTTRDDQKKKKRSMWLVGPGPCIRRSDPCCCESWDLSVVSPKETYFVSRRKRSVGTAAKFGYRPRSIH